ncbi:MAG: hypothetical protein WCA46_03675, partial [Actinocatenispora sp.]
MELAEAVALGAAVGAVAGTGVTLGVGLLRRGRSAVSGDRRPAGRSGPVAARNGVESVARSAPPTADGETTAEPGPPPGRLAEASIAA